MQTLERTAVKTDKYILWSKWFLGIIEGEKKMISVKTEILEMQ